jgi:hypothetical protein
MKLLARAVVTGFGLAVGAAIFKKIAARLGLEDKEAKRSDAPDLNAQDGGTDPGLQHEFS